MTDENGEKVTAETYGAGCYEVCVCVCVCVRMCAHVQVCVHMCKCVCATIKGGGWQWNSLLVN